MNEDQVSNQTGAINAPLTGEARAAKREVTAAVGELAASPLDVPAADRMREVLSTPRMRRAARILSRLPRRTELAVVIDEKPLEEPEEPCSAAIPAPDRWAPVVVVGGAE